MSIWAALDAISAKAKTINGIKQSYTATGSGVSSAGDPVPPSIDAGPISIVWIGSGTLDAGNMEDLWFYPRLNVWVGASDAGYAYKTLAAFPDLVIAAFRSGITLGGQVQECKLTGWDDPTSETMNNGLVYLVLSFAFKVHIITTSNTLYSE